MKSTLSSKNSVSVQAANLNLVFRSEYYRSGTWRDFFVRVIDSPLETLLAEKERLHILKDLNFNVTAGERVGLVGVNGTGKTSLCRCVAGLYRPTAGSLQVNGELRAVFNTYVGIQPELTGRENAELLAQFIYPREKNRRKIIEEALEFSELGDFLDTPFRHYSNGMQARLCLSVATAKAADILILDEVFDGADRFFREKISKRILEVIKKSGIVFFVSHASEQVEQVCNRLIVLGKGRILYDGQVGKGLDFYSKIEDNLRLLGF